MFEWNICNIFLHIDAVAILSPTSSLGQTRTRLTVMLHFEGAKASSIWEIDFSFSRFDALHSCSYSIGPKLVDVCVSIPWVWRILSRNAPLRSVWEFEPDHTSPVDLLGHTLLASLCGPKCGYRQSLPGSTCTYDPNIVA